MPDLVIGEQWFEAALSPGNTSSSSDGLPYEEWLTLEPPPPPSDSDIESLLGGHASSPPEGTPLNADVSMTSSGSGEDIAAMLEPYCSALPISPLDSSHIPHPILDFDFTSVDLETILAL